MRQILLREVTFCDHCGKESEYTTSCLECGKEFCLDCRKEKLKEYSAGVFFSGHGDGHYCHICDEVRSNNPTPLYVAYRRIQHLREEYATWNKHFDALRKAAEARLELLLAERTRHA